MRRLFYRMVLPGAYLLTLRPASALAAIFEGGGSGQTTDAQRGVELIEGSLEGSGVTGEGDLAVLVLKYVKFLLPFLALAAFVGYVYAGILYVTAFGNEDMLQKSKKILIYSTIGLVLVILAFTIVQVFTADLVEFIEEE